MFDLNRFWQVRERRGPEPSLTLQELTSEAFQYFQWVDEHPLQEEVLFQYKGEVTREIASKKRPYTWKGLAIYLGMHSSALTLYNARDEYRDLMLFIADVIYTQKFEGAAAGFFNAGLISRDLGLVDQKALSGPGGGPIQTEEVLSGEQLEKELDRRGIPRSIVDNIVGGVGLPDEVDEPDVTPEE